MKTTNWIKIGAIFSFIGFIFILISWILSYPIEILGINKITFTQFYPILWPGIVFSLLGLFVVSYKSKNKIIGAFCCSLFPLVLNIPAFFFSYIATSDSGNAKAYFQIFHITGIDPKATPYFGFPSYFSLNEIIHQTINIDVKGIALLSFTLYGVLLGLFLYLFFYNLKKERYIEIIPFLLVILYFIGMYSFINYQWVPQTLALVYFFILIFISTYMLSNPVKIEWKIFFILFFIVLVFTHPILPVLFLSFFSMLTIKKRYLFQIFLVITALYVIVTIYYTSTYFHLYIITLEQSISGFNREYVNVVGTSLRGTSDLIDQIISFSNRITVPIVWIIASIGTVILFLKKKINFLLIGLGFSGGFYLAFGLFYSILGLRALQILLIPLTIGFMYFFSKWKKLTVVIIVIILILSVFGPMRTAYNHYSFQTDEEAFASDFLANNIKNASNPKVAIGQVNFGYFTSIYLFLKHFPYQTDFAMRPGNPGFLNVFNDSIHKNEFIIYNSNLGREILVFLMTKENLTRKLELVMNNNKIYDSGTTFISNGIKAI
jgi:hypothetical protein